MKLEMHLHTMESSSCSICPAKKAVERYLRLGYDGMVVTDHFTSDTAKGLPWKLRINKFLYGFHKAREAAPDNFSVLLGMELRFVHEDSNDYLVYGISEEFLQGHKGFERLGLKEFSKLARKNGLFLVQAHPFRRGMTVIDPKYLDAMEVYNGHAGHDSRNEIAARWAEMHNLPPMSGSDYHGGKTGNDAAPGGIILPHTVADSPDLASLLRKGEYQCLLY